MAANDYYTSHPQNPSVNPVTGPYLWNTPNNFTTTNTSYDPCRTSAASHAQYALALPNEPTNLSSSPSGSSSSTERGLFSSGGPKQSKSERAMKFVEKQVRKQIEKKSNSHAQSHQTEEQINQALGQEQGGGGEYGYGAADQGYGIPEGMDFGSGEGNFEWSGSGGDWLGDLDLGGLGDALGV